MDKRAMRSAGTDFPMDGLGTAEGRIHPAPVMLNLSVSVLLQKGLHALYVTCYTKCVKLLEANWPQDVRL